MPPSSRAEKQRDKQLYQIEKLICEAKPMLPGAPGQGRGRAQRA